MDRKDKINLFLIAVCVLAVTALIIAVIGYQQPSQSKMIEKQNTEIYSLNQALAIFATHPRTDWDSSTWQLNQSIPVRATLTDPAVGISSATIAFTINIYSKSDYFGANIQYSNGETSPTILVDNQTIVELKTLQLIDS
ncbi:Uncharacterised protein [uncultured archaeon]|nr:Uncharacterised protein [uncultured archaeon]